MVLFTDVIIGNRAPVGDAAHPVDAPGAHEHGFTEHGLARRRVTDNGKVSDVPRLIAFHRFVPLLRHGGSHRVFLSAASKMTNRGWPVKKGLRHPDRPQGFIKLLDLSLSSIGWRRGLGRGGAFLLVSPQSSPHSFLAGRG